MAFKWKAVGIETWKFPFSAYQNHTMAKLYCNTVFLYKQAYLADIFEKLHIYKNHFKGIKYFEKSPQRN